MNIEYLATEAKRKLEKGIEYLNSFDAEAKFNWELNKPGVREFSLNGCRVVAMPEDFRELERKFKLCNMSADLVDEFAESVIKGINKMFDYYNEHSLTESECTAIRTVIHKYFI